MELVCGIGYAAWKKQENILTTNGNKKSVLIFPNNGAEDAWKSVWPAFQALGMRVTELPSFANVTQARCDLTNGVLPSLRIGDYLMTHLQCREWETVPHANKEFRSVPRDTLLGPVEEILHVTTKEWLKARARDLSRISN